MKLPTLALVSITLVGLSCAVFAAASRSPCAKVVPGESGVTSAPVEVNARARDVEALRDEMVALRAEVARLREQVRTSSAPKPSAQVAQEPAITTSVAASREEAENQRHAIMTQMETEFVHQTRDPQWAASTSLAIQEALNADALLRTAGGQVECRSQSCRVELVEDTPGKLTASLRLVTRRLSNTLPSVSVNYVDEGDGRTTIVMFMRQSAADAEQSTRK